jgi:hypothetical protein
MSSESFDEARIRKKRPWIIVGSFLCFLAAGIIIFAYLRSNKIPDIGGSIRMEADPDTRFYIGYRLVGTTRVTIPWTELLGDEDHDPLAIELPYPAGKVTPELISGPGAVLLQSRNLSRGRGPAMSESEDSYLLRRADGTLDHVVSYLIDLRPGNQSRRYVILVRARIGQSGSTTSLEHWRGMETEESNPGFVKIFGKSPLELNQIWNFSPYQEPPDEFKSEIEAKGLWEPGDGK